MAPGTYTGSVAISKSNADRTIPVTMRLTAQPIAVVSTSSIDLRLAEGGPSTTYPYLPAISLSNRGAGTLEVTGVTAAGAGVSAHAYPGGAIVTVDPSLLATGSYAGSVTISCNAVNCPIVVPVRLEVVPKSGPLLYYQSVVDNATFNPGDPVSPGDVVVVRGEQLSLSDPAVVEAAPLPTRLGGATVLVNGSAAPLFYSSFGQIAFQLPGGTAIGHALIQVERDGQASNTISVTVAPRAPRIVVVTDASYHVRDLDHPSKAGDTLILWAIGLGPTHPAVPDGAPAPSDPPAALRFVPTVQFYGDGGIREVVPLFAGLSAGGVGLYQVSVTLPIDLPKGVANMRLTFPDMISNSVRIAIQ